MWDLIVSVPDHCLSFYFPRRKFLLNDLKVRDCSAMYAYIFLAFSTTNTQSINQNQFK